MVRNRLEKGVETSDAERFGSRRRLSTAGLKDPLRIARLPERNPLHNKPLFGEIHKCLQG